jgi:glycine betaine/proline transport system substrate-binding protein
MFSISGRRYSIYILAALLGVVSMFAVACGDGEGASAEDVQSIVEGALAQQSATGPTAKEIQATVEEAIGAAAADSPTAQEIQTLVETVVNAATSGSLTSADVATLVGKALLDAEAAWGAKPLTAAQVGNLVESALATELASALSAEDVQQIVEDAVMVPKETIVFADLNWDSAQIQNAIARYIVENGYGYPTEAIFGGTIPLFVGLLGGDIDVSMEIWLPNQNDVWEPALAAGQVIPVGKSLDDNWQSAYVVPTYLAEENPELKTVQDIRDHMDIFPQEGGKVVLWSCISSWACSEINESQSVAYGLDDILEMKDPGSQAGLFASLIGAYEKGDPWLGYLWGPTQPSAELDLTRLEEPACGAGEEPGDGCAYPVSLVRIAVHPTLLPRAPDVIEFLRKWDFSADADVAANAYKAESGANFEEVAIWFLQNRGDVWTGWVTHEAAVKVKAALPG